MQQLRHESDPGVAELLNAIGEATGGTLCSLFFDPESPEGKRLASDIQAVVPGILKALLKGRDASDLRAAMYGRAIPMLMIDDRFFGPMRGPGRYLVCRFGPQGEELVLEPGQDEFKAATVASSAFESYEAAAGAALAYLRKSGCDMAAARKMGLRVVPGSQVDARPAGYVAKGTGIAG